MARVGRTAPRVVAAGSNVRAGRHPGRSTGLVLAAGLRVARPSGGRAAGARSGAATARSASTAPTVAAQRRPAATADSRTAHDARPWVAGEMPAAATLVVGLAGRVRR